jgi:hypothetical protein
MNNKLKTPKKTHEVIFPCGGHFVISPRILPNDQSIESFSIDNYDPLSRLFLKRTDRIFKFDDLVQKAMIVRDNPKMNIKNKKS